MQLSGEDLMAIRSDLPATCARMKMIMVLGLSAFSGGCHDQARLCFSAENQLLHPPQWRRSGSDSPQLAELV